MVSQFPTLRVGSRPCRCSEPAHDPRLVVITGGPGAGKTAVLELAARSFCEHVAILPEAATIVFGGGFPRHDTTPGLRAAQRAIFAVQKQLEGLVLEEHKVAIALCDRGTIDGMAYWPGESDSFWGEMATTLDQELARYRAVIHLRVPGPDQGYHTGSIRNESADRAAQVDRRILAAWAHHPNRVVVSAGKSFADKAQVALESIRATLPVCCRQHWFPPQQEQED